MLKKMLPLAAAAALATGLVGCYEGPADEGFEGGGGGEIVEPYENEGVLENEDEGRVLENEGAIENRGVLDNE